MVARRRVAGARVGVGGALNPYRESAGFTRRGVGDHKLDAAVLGAAAGCLIAGNRSVGAETLGFESASVDADGD